MESKIQGKPAFAYLDVTLEPGEAITAESDAMSTMHGDLDVRARLNGSLCSAACKRLLGHESLFVSEFANRTKGDKKICLSQKTPGDIMCRDLENDAVCLQPGAFIAATPGIRLGIKWAGISSWVGREGLFKLVARGRGRVWYGAYGALVEQELTGPYIIDTSHLVAYDPSIRLKTQLAGGVFSSFFGGEGLVTRLEGRGKYTIQTRSVTGFASWLNPKLV